MDENAALLATLPVDDDGLGVMSPDALLERWRGHISRGLIYEGIRDGTIPSIAIGRRRLIPIAALKAKLAGGKP